MLVTTSRELAEAVLARVPVLTGAWPTGDIAGAAWRDHGEILLAADVEEAASLADQRAPEHLEVHARDLDWWLSRLRSYGSLFLGEDATVAEVALLGRRRTALDDVAARIRARGGVARALPCDVTRRTELEHLVAAIAVPDVLVTCAGGNRPEPFVDVDDDALDWSWRLNVHGAFVAAQLCARRMIEAQRPGAIVHVTSRTGTSARRTGPRLRGEARRRGSHEGDGDRAGSAWDSRQRRSAPTFVETSMTRPFLAEPGARRAIEARIPLGRLGRAEEVADAVLFAASSPLMTGASLRCRRRLDRAVTRRRAGAG